MKLQAVLFAISAVCVSAACPAGKGPRPSSAVSSAVPTTASATVLQSQAPVAAVAADISSEDPDGSAFSGSVNVLSAAAVSGTSTFYGGNLNGGACSFTTMSGIPSGLYGTAFSGSAWNNAAQCGACLEVTGPSGKIKVMVGRGPLISHMVHHKLTRSFRLSISVPSVTKATWISSRMVSQRLAPFPQARSLHP